MYDGNIELEKNRFSVAERASGQAISDERGRDTGYVIFSIKARQTLPSLSL